MPLFEIGDDELIPFRRVPAGPELYEQEIETLLWENLESFVGTPLFPVARQATVGGGLKPDILALDLEGQPHVIEVKRDIDRKQLAQCLEYAGWARETGLDELANLFHEGPEAFFPAWMEFTGTDYPRLVGSTPEVVLVARDFDDRTDSALSYLVENGLPVTVLRVTVYQDSQNRRFVDVGSDHEVEVQVAETKRERSTPQYRKFDGRRPEVSDLIDAGLLMVGTSLSWTRPRLGETYRATVGESGELVLVGGRRFSTPSRAAKEAAGIVAYDGWHAWQLPDGRKLGDLRDALLDGGGSDDD